jgi:hypothetical protein
VDGAGRAWLLGAGGGVGGGGIAAAAVGAGDNVGEGVANQLVARG